jgi:hypothetical protein
MDLLPQSALKLQRYNQSRSSKDFPSVHGRYAILPHQHDNFVLSTPVVVGSVERAPRTIPSNQQEKPEKIEV